MVTTGSWQKVELLDDGFSAFNPRAVKSLQKILNETAANIVLSTSHRHSFSPELWKSIFFNRGIIVNKILQLPKSTKRLSRKDEILEWAYNVNYEDGFVI